MIEYRYMSRLIIPLLRVAIIGAAICGLFGAIVVIPGTAAAEVERFPPYEPLAVPYATAAILAVACILVSLVAVWALLSLIRRDALFTDRAFPWVNLIIGCFAFATLLSAGVTVHLFFAEIPSPTDGMELLGALFTTVACTGLGGSFVLILLILRQLLRKAVRLRNEMAEVI